MPSRLIAVAAVIGAALLGTVFSVRSSDGPDAKPAVRADAPLARSAPQLPAGVRVIGESEGFVATHDAVAGRLHLPTGRVQVDDFWVGDPQVEVEVPAGRPTVHVTYARSVRSADVDGGAVALVTLVTDPLPPVFWRYAGTMGTDGGTGGFASAEAAERMRNGSGLQDRLLDRLQAGRRNGIAEVRTGEDLNLFAFSAGLGDGGYGVYVGSAADGRVTRVVFDGGLLHLAWPDDHSRR